VAREALVRILTDREARGDDPSLEKLRTIIRRGDKDFAKNAEKPWESDWRARVSGAASRDFDRRRQRGRPRPTEASAGRGRGPQAGPLCTARSGAEGRLRQGLPRGRSELARRTADPEADHSWTRL